MLTLLQGVEDDIEVKQILAKADLAASKIDLNQDQNSEQIGVVNAVDQSWQFSTAQLQRKIASMPANRRHFFYTWSGNKGQEFTGSASGVDRHSYFANSFLIGYKPFDTNTVWQPLATLALRKRYTLDNKLYGPQYSDIWQNSRQAYAYTRGDCEDHAIVLADWLIAMGYDARVVVGKYKTGGHAWVILFEQGKEYILEATSKGRTRSINDFIYARLATDYHPSYQFNRDDFWVNTGSTFTTLYRNEKWQKRSTFKRSSQLQL